MLDPKYDALRVLIDTGALTYFLDITDHIPAEELAEDLDWELSYLNYVLSHPKIISLDILKPIVDLINCEIDKLLILVMNQYLAEKGER
jgi:hypothetical protein